MALEVRRKERTPRRHAEPARPRVVEHRRTSAFPIPRPPNSGGTSVWSATSRDWIAAVVDPAGELAVDPGLVAAPLEVVLDGQALG